MKYLEQALQLAGTGPDTVKVSQGEYHPGDTWTTNNADQSIPFLVKPQITIAGGYRGMAGIGSGTADVRNFITYTTILSGDLDDDDVLDSDNSLVVVQAGNASFSVGANTQLDGLTIRDGYGGKVSGGVLGGAGLHIYEGSYVTVNQCKFLNNWVPNTGFGGGVFVNNQNESISQQTSFTGCTISDNESGHGGGLAGYHSFLEITDSEISNNKVDAHSNHPGGGGFDIDGGAARFINVDVTGNEVDSANSVARNKRVILNYEQKE